MNSYFRRKVSYKHYEYSSQSQDDTSVAQETLQDKIVSPIPPTQCLQQESFTPNQQCEEEEVTGKLIDAFKFNNYTIYNVSLLGYCCCC